MPTTEITLTIEFRRSGWQRRLREGDTVRLVGPQAETVAELPGAIVLTLLRHYLAGVRLQMTLAQHCRPGPPLDPDPPAPPDPRPRLAGTHGRALRR